MTGLVERLVNRSGNGRVFHADRKLFAEAAEAIATLRVELAEEARLNGMGSEREARLMAERDKARREAGRAYRRGIEDAAKVAEKAGEPYALHTQNGAMMFRACTEKIAAAIRSLPADRRAAREASNAEEGR